MNLEEKDVSRRASMQDYRAFPLFLSQEIWDALADRRVTQLGRVDRLARYLVNTLGLRHPTEPSMAVVASLVGHMENVTDAEVFKLVPTVKSVLKTTVTRAKQGGIPLPAGRYLENLPNQVQDLPSDVTQQVAPAGFAVPPTSLDLNAVWQTARTIPLRNTHRDVQLQKQLESQQNVMLGFADPRVAGSLGFREARFEKLEIEKLHFEAGSFVLELLSF